MQEYVAVFEGFPDVVVFAEVSGYLVDFQRRGVSIESGGAGKGQKCLEVQRGLKVEMLLGVQVKRTADGLGERAAARSLQADRKASFAALKDFFHGGDEIFVAFFIHAHVGVAGNAEEAGAGQFPAGEEAFAPGKQDVIEQHNGAGVRGAAQVAEAFKVLRKADEGALAVFKAEGGVDASRGGLGDRMPPGRGGGGRGGGVFGRGGGGRAGRG